MSESLNDPLVELELRVTRLEALLSTESRGTKDPIGQSAQSIEPSDVVAWLKSEGLIREPTVEELRLAAEWDSLTDDEKNAVLWELDHLPPGPMVSDIIAESRH